jgi:hypothetical protein
MINCAAEKKSRKQSHEKSLNSTQKEIPTQEAFRTFFSSLWFFTVSEFSHESLIESTGIGKEYFAVSFSTESL